MEQNKDLSFEEGVKAILKNYPQFYINECHEKEVSLGYIYNKNIELRIDLYNGVIACLDDGFTYLSINEVCIANDIIKLTKEREK